MMATGVTVSTDRVFHASLQPQASVLADSVAPIAFEGSMGPNAPVPEESHGTMQADFFVPVEHQ